MKKFGLVAFLLAGVLLLAACQGAAGPSEQKFSLGISDNSGGNKNGAPTLT